MAMIWYYLEHEQKRQQIALAGYQALAEHTYEKLEIFERIGLGGDR